MRRRGVAAAACLAAIILGASVASEGTGKQDGRTALPAPIDQVVPPIGTPDDAVSALQHLRMHPGRESLEPTEAVRNRPPTTTEEPAQ